MDPLSITTSAIAVIGAIHQAGKCIDQLNTIRKAPRELSLLLDEVADLHELLKQVQQCQNPPAYAKDGAVRPTESPSGPDWQISRISTKLSELDHLLQRHSLRTTRRAPDFGWARGRQKANALRADLKLLRLNLAAGLSASTSETVNRIESAVEGIRKEQLTPEQLFTSLVRGWTLVNKFPSFEVCREDGSIHCTFSGLELGPDKKNSSNGQLSPKAFRMTRNPPGVLTTTKPHGTAKAVRVSAKKFKAACESWCSCTCHTKRTLRVRQPSVVGPISLSYTGLPWTAASCDQKSCRSKSEPTITMKVQFPAWVWRRYLSSSFSYTSIGGLDMNLKLPRTVSWWSLWRHASDGNLSTIQSLFSQGLASPLDVQALGGSLLHYAAGYRHWDLCKFLIEQGAILDNEDDFHDSPTGLAWGKVLSGELSEDEESKVASMFSDTDYLLTRQFSILHKIVLHLIPRTLQSELDFSTRELDAVDADGRTCVNWAATRGDEDALNTLLHYDANINIADEQGNTPLLHVRNLACMEILLAAGADISARNKFGQNALHMVCRDTGSVPLAKRLLQAGIDINATDSSGETALNNAVFRKYHDCSLYLIEEGADVDIAGAIDGMGDAPIDTALMTNQATVLQLLLARSAKYARTNAYNRTILHLAADTVHEDTIDVLKGHGLRDIDVSIRDLDGKTAEDILGERTDDDAHPGFKAKFQELLDAIAAARRRSAAAAAEVSMGPEFVDVQELATRRSGALVERLKDDSVVTQWTPVSSDDGFDDYEHDDNDDKNDTHGRVLVFFDAPEEVTDEVPRLVEITV